MKNALVLCVAIMASCGGSHPVLEDLSHREQFPQFQIQSMRGVRDGDRLRAQVMISDSSSILSVEMDFAVGSPTTLRSGTWRWSRGNQVSNGTVASRSVTFLGGQDGPPSLGGTFDLLEAGGTALYRIHLPTTQLRPPA